MDIDVCSIAFIGLGEAASAIISGWGDHRNKQIKAFDIKLQGSDTKEEIISRASKLNPHFYDSNHFIFTGECSNFEATR